MNTIALVMIARDEARCIARALASARPWVDQMWVLDTGSRDDTVAIAQAQGAQVAHFRWCDDFSAARNAALALTDATWRLVLDADEWINGDASELHAWRSRAPEVLGLLRVVSHAVDAQGLHHEAPSWLPRLLPRGVGYAGCIHEQPLAAALKRERLQFSLLHDGYAPAQAQAKRGRNQRLLKQALRLHPGDAYLRYQLGKDHEVQADYVQAEAHYALAWAACESGQADAGWRHDLLVRRLFTLKKLGRFDLAVPLAQAQMSQWGHSPDFYFTLGDLLLDWAACEPARAPALLPMIESSWLQAIEIGEQPGLQDSVCGRGSWLAAHNLAVLHDGLGDQAQAETWRRRERALRADAEAGGPRTPA